ncbi:MAG TPA: hypothetical protein VF941_07855 [Clostridia bacterium]
MLPFTLNCKLQIITTFSENQVKTILEAMLNHNRIYSTGAKDEQFNGKVNSNEFKAKTVGELGRGHIPIVCYGIVENIDNKRVVSVKCNFGIYPWYAISILTILVAFLYYLILDLGLNMFSGCEYILTLPLLFVLLVYFVFVIVFSRRVKKIEKIFKINLSSNK